MGQNCCVNKDEIQTSMANIWALSWFCLPFGVLLLLTQINTEREREREMTHTHTRTLNNRKKLVFWFVGVSTAKLWYASTFNTIYTFTHVKNPSNFVRTWIDFMLSRRKWWCMFPLLFHLPMYIIDADNDTQKPWFASPFSHIHNFFPRFYLFDCRWICDFRNVEQTQEGARNHNNGLCFRIPLNLDYVVFQRGIWKKDRNLIWQFHWIRIHFTSREINRSQKNSIILKVLSMYYANSRPFLSYIIILSEKGSNSSKSHRFHQNHMQNVYFLPVWHY